jgi:hypothetical protein
MNFDPVNCPAHYREDRRFEVIDVLEDWASRAPDPVLGGLLWQSCKYLGRLFDKADPLEDAKKARWYLSRLISKLEAADKAAEALEAEALAIPGRTLVESVDPFNGRTPDEVGVVPVADPFPFDFSYNGPATRATLSARVDPFDDPLR